MVQRRPGVDKLRTEGAASPGDVGTRITSGAATRRHRPDRLVLYRVKVILIARSPSADVNLTR